MDVGDPPVDARSRSSGIYPTVDPLTSRSRLLDTASCDPRRTSRSPRGSAQALALAPPRRRRPTTERRSARAQAPRFFAQPFFVAEPYTRGPASPSAAPRRFATCRDILDGVLDALPEEAFYFTGGMDAVRAKAEVDRIDAMTEQKPPGMSWESWIEQQIREAREAGLFDNLPGAGKPLPSLAGRI